MNDYLKNNKKCNTLLIGDTYTIADFALLGYLSGKLSNEKDAVHLFLKEAIEKY